MPEVLPQINQEPPQGIQSIIDTGYIWNPDVANELIAKVNELLEKLEGARSRIFPYEEIDFAIPQYMPCYYNEAVYIALEDIEVKPEEFDPSKWLMIASKGAQYTAGENITIEDDVISAKDTTYTAGEGIDITDGVISNTQTSAVWGNIEGSLDDQADLKAALDDKQDVIDDLDEIRSGAEAGSTAAQPDYVDDVVATETEAREQADEIISGQVESLSTIIDAEIQNRIDADAELEESKQDVLTAGDNIIIDGTTISATDTTYTAGVGLTLTGTEFGVNIVDNTVSESTIAVLSARVGKVLQDQIDNLKGRGKYLSIWNCTTGLAMDTPPVDPYVYETGSFFIVGVVGTTNYKPTGSSYSASTPSTVVETEAVKTNDTYYYDGTTWRLLQTPEKLVAFSSLAGSPEDNTALKNALDAKQDELTAGSGIDITNGTISVTDPVVKNTASNTTQNLAIGGSVNGSGFGKIVISSNWNRGTVGSTGSIVIGGGSTSTDASYAIQLGGVNATQNKNSESKTFCVGFSNSENYKLLDSNGTIPEARLADTTSATEGQVLTLDENGDAVWATPAGGAVDSVNGQTGTVVLDAEDVGALSTSGGTLDGTITSYGSNVVMLKAYQGEQFPNNYITIGNIYSSVIKFHSQFGVAGSSDILMGADSSGHKGMWPNLDNVETLGISQHRWTNVYTTKLNNGADINVPNEAGTLAVASNHSTATTGQVLTKTASGAEWADAQGGSGLPDPTGHEGEFLTNDGTDASWADINAMEIIDWEA